MTTPQVEQSSDRLSHADICEFMPAEMMFGDPLQPHHLREIISAVRSAQPSTPIVPAQAEKEWPMEPQPDGSVLPVDPADIGIACDSCGLTMAESKFLASAQPIQPSTTDSDVRDAEDSKIVNYIINKGIRGSTYMSKTGIEVIVDVGVLESQGPRAALLAAAIKSMAPDTTAANAGKGGQS